MNLADCMERGDMWERMARDYARLYRVERKAVAGFREILRHILLRLDLEAEEKPGAQFPCATMREDIRKAICNYGVERR